MVEKLSKFIIKKLFQLPPIEMHHKHAIYIYFSGRSHIMGKTYSALDKVEVFHFISDDHRVNITEIILWKLIYC